MARMPREIPVEIRLDVPGSMEASEGIGLATIEAAIARLIHAEVERRIVTERGSFLRILAHLAFQHGEVELEAKGRGAQATIHIPDAALVGDDPEVVTWRDKGEAVTVYRVRRTR
jgi:hypothetical protein